MEAIEVGEQSLIRPFMRGSDFKAVQAKLISLGYGVGAGGSDGLFGADTEAAVAQFQDDRGLDPVDGIVGRQTRQALGLPVT